VLEARRSLDEVVRLQRSPVEVAKVHDILVPAVSGHLPCRVYDPQREGTPPIIIYLHGGGWMLGSVLTTDGPCRRLAQASGCIVISVEYRRAPETAFPGPLEDCISAVHWVSANAAVLGGDAERLFILGDSAGGNLAAAVTLCLRESGDVLPPQSPPLPSWQEHAGDPLMRASTMAWFWEGYLGKGGSDDWRAAPMLAPDVSGLPPAVIVVAEFDVLRDEALLYAQRLKEAGIETDVALFPGAPHGFWWMDAVLSQAAELDGFLGRAVQAMAN